MSWAFSRGHPFSSTWKFSSDRQALTGQQIKFTAHIAPTCAVRIRNNHVTYASEWCSK